MPAELEHIDKKLSSTLQFINVAINPSDSCEVMGGTQDNGTWSNPDELQPQHLQRRSSTATAATPVTTRRSRPWRFNEFTGGFSDSNFRNGDPERWVITSAPIVNSGEGPAFYWPQIGDPNPTPGTHPIYCGREARLADAGVRRRHSAGTSRRTRPGHRGLRGELPGVRDRRAPRHGCGDYRPLGGPYCDGLASTPTIPSCINQPGDLTGTVYGSDRTGGSISWLARDSADHGTLWAATSAGRHLRDAQRAMPSDPATVTWHRIDSSTRNSPTRFPSGIYVDPATPATRG